MNLENKVAIVTGAGQGIGRGIALALFHSGAKIVVADLNEENAKKVATEIGEESSLGVKCDVSNAEDVKNLVNKTMDKFGQLDILVNNAGIFPFVSFLEMKENEWDKVMDVNLKGTFLCTKAAVKEMNEGGKIINISSIASQVGFEGLTHYCASKSGVNGFTRALALELADKKINVNAVAPGAIDTPGVSSSSNEEIVNQTVAMIPAKRMGNPMDIAGAVVYLASDMADYVTGQVITVDGGFVLR